MPNLADKIGIVTGGGSGMGRELVRQLAAEGASVAMCDVSRQTMEETKALCVDDGLISGVRITCHVVDVSDEEQVARFRQEVAAEHGTDKIHLLFNNAGIGAGGSLFTDSRANWERTFNVCWFGVYYMTRAFLPMLVKADEGHITNTSSVNGFFASIGPNAPHTAYSAAKFAVKGFTEALINALRLNAPHIKCSVVMPGHIGTDIVANSRKVRSWKMTYGGTFCDLASSSRVAFSAANNISDTSRGTTIGSSAFFNELPLKMSAKDSVASAMSACECPKIPARNFAVPKMRFTAIPKKVARNPRSSLSLATRQC